MAVNKVVYDGETIIDISDSTVTEDTLLSGTVAYNASGERIVGTALGGTTTEVVWENPSPSSAFAAKTVSMDLSEGDTVDVFYRWSTRILSERIRVGDSATLFAIGNISNDGNYPRIYARIVTVNTTGITFEECYAKQTNQDDTLGAQNGYCVPIAVHVTKGVQLI